MAQRSPSSVMRAPRPLGISRWQSLPRWLRDDMTGYLFIMPWIIGLLAFTLGPFLASLYLSFTEWNVIGSRHYVGLDNWFHMLTQDARFRTSLWNTFYYVIFHVPGIQLIGLSLAMLLNQDLRGISIYRTLFYLPSITSGVATAVLWSWIFNNRYGLANLMLARVGIEGPNWLFSLTWSMPALIIMSLWGAGRTMIIYLAGLQGIPQALYEAAEVDGAGEVYRFTHITVPLLTPSIFFNMIMGIIGSFQVFTSAYIITGGGPADTTLMYVLYLYRTAFENLDMGYACTLAWMLFLIILFFTIIQLVLSKRWVYYEAGARF